jgi:hypothetical protein
MKVGELYMIHGNENKLRNMYNNGFITCIQFEKMKTPSPGVLIRFESDALPDEVREVMKKKIEQVNNDLSKYEEWETSMKKHELMMIKEKLIPNWTRQLTRKSNPRAYGYFMYDGKVLAKIKLEDVKLMRVI